jgi:hypothetical protein
MAEGPTVSRWQRVASLAKTLFWLVLIVVVLQQVYGSNRLETARSSVLDRFQQQRKSRVIALINRQETVTLFGVPVSSSISIEDSEAVLRAIRLTPEDQPIDVILHTPGGLVLAAEQISKALVQRKAKVTAFVPHYAMSGGSLWIPNNHLMAAAGVDDSPEEALARMVMLPGAHYSDPEFSWKFEVAPAGIGFMNGGGIGAQYNGDLFMGAARPFLEGGFLWHFNLTGNRQKIGVDDPRLEDRVADNLDKPSPTDPAANERAMVESESLLFGRNFGVATDIKTGPNGNLFVVSLSNGAIYEIFRR